MKTHTSPAASSLVRKTLSVALPAFALATLSHAAPLLQENFDNLSVGDLGGQNNWTAQSGVAVTAGGLSYQSGAITIDGGSHHAQSTQLSPNTGTPLATHAFAAQSGEVWFSFTLLVNNSTNTSRYWFWVSDTTDINTGVTGAVSDNNTNNKNLFAEIRTVSTPTSTVTGTATEDQVYFFVARLSKDGAATNANAYDRLELWVNPDSTSLTGGFVANAPANAGFTGGIQHFGLTTLSANATLQWDNLLVGTSQADVLDVYAIPEPATYATLGGVAALGLAALRRRR